MIETLVWCWFGLFAINVLGGPFLIGTPMERTAAGYVIGLVERATLVAIFGRVLGWW